MGRYDGGKGLFSTAEYTGRGAVKLAPDALVYINQALQGAYTDRFGNSRLVDFQNAITSINIQNNVDPPGSSTATIEIATPIYDERSSFWIPVVDDSGQTHLYPWFTSMMEVQVFLRGRFLVGPTPKYYSAFCGFITHVDENYTNGMYRIQLQCADMLHWWQYIQISFRPSVEENVYVRGNAGLTAYGTRYEMANPFEIIYSLCEKMGFENFITPSWVGKLTPDSQTQGTDPRWLSVYYTALNYWNARFSGRFGTNNLRMYGASGSLIDPSDPRKAFREHRANPPPNTKSSPDPSQQSTANDYDVSFDVDAQIEKFQVFFEYANMGKGLSEAEYKSKLEVATEVKNRIEYEFFQDVNGNFIFKPPFYNLNTKPLMAYNIKPQDIINFSALENSEEVITAIEVAASISQNIRDVNWVNRIGYHVDIDLVKKYGFRYRKIDSWWISESTIARSYAVGEMGLINAKAHTGSITIPGRPEIRLGYPVYIAHKDRFYYVKSISHAFDYGGSFTTTLSLEGERSRVYDQGFSVQKNLVYRFNKDTRYDDLKVQQIFSHEKEVAILKANQKREEEARKKQEKEGIATTTKLQQNPDVTGRETTGDVPKDMESFLRATGTVSSTRPGIYSLETDPTTLSITEMQIPFSDDQGYRVIGGFRYGRGIQVKPGTVIDVNESTIDTQAPIDPVPSTVVNILPEAAYESAAMEAYHEVNLQASVEGPTVPYRRLLDEAATPKPSETQIAANLVNMTPPKADLEELTDQQLATQGLAVPVAKYVRKGK